MMDNFLLFDTTMWDDSAFEETKAVDTTVFFDCQDASCDVAMEGVELEDDFEGLLFSQDSVDSTLTATDAFEPPAVVVEASEEEAFVASTLSEPLETSKTTPPRRKKRRSKEDRDSASHQPPTKLLVTTSQLTSDHPSVDIDTALLKLASSMRRSEMSRNEIIRRQQLGDSTQTRSSFGNSLLQGTSATLNSSLEQSRSMLQTYISQMKGPMM